MVNPLKTNNVISCKHNVELIATSICQNLTAHKKLVPTENTKLSVFCYEPNKELDDAGLKPVNNNKTPIK